MQPKTIGDLRALKHPQNKPDHSRGNSNERGYGAAHQRYRSWLLNERMLDAADKDKSLCEDCASEGKRFEAPRQPLELHHIQSVAARPDLRFEPSNAMFLCPTHHAKRTRKGE